MRRLIAVTAAALMLSACFASARPAIPDSLPQFKRYETVKLAEGVYAFISPESNGAMVTGNSLLVIGEEGALVVDSGHFPSLTQRMIDEIKTLTHKPVRFLVNTHWHPDHNAGNGLYLEAFPGLEIVSTERTREGIRVEIPKKEVNEAIIAQFEDGLKTGMGRGGKPLTPEQRQYYEKVAPELTVFRPELKRADHALPTTTFGTSMSVHLGGREVRILFLGRGNTGGDAVVYVPDSKVLATGDLVVYPVPYPFGSYIGEWIETLKKLEAMEASLIVPGHGPILRDKEYIQLNIALLESTKAQAESAFKSGVSLEEATKKVDLAGLRSRFVGNSTERAQFFDLGYVPAAMARAYREAKEGPLQDED